MLCYSFPLLINIIFILSKLNLLTACSNLFSVKYIHFRNKSLFSSNQHFYRLDNTFLSRSGLSQQLRNRAKERDRNERRRSSGNNLPSGMVPRVVRRNDRGGSDRTSSEIENCKYSHIIKHIDIITFFSKDSGCISRIVSMKGNYQLIF